MHLFYLISHTVRMYGMMHGSRVHIEKLHKQIAQASRSSDNGFKL